SDLSGDYYNYFITTDLTHNNQGADTSSNGNIPDDIPIYFKTSSGTINNSAPTKKGKAEVKIIGNSTGTAIVRATLYNLTVSHQLNITRVNLLGVYNTRTNKSFVTIQEAIDDIDTINGDTITLAEGTYTENIIINKKLIIQPFNGSDVTIQAGNSDKSVFVIDSDGSGTTIQNLKIIGSNDSYGIALSHAYNTNLNNNIILNSSKGIYLYLSGNNIINNNIIEDNYYGIALYKSTVNTITGNILEKNETSIYLYDSNYNQIKDCTVKENWYGINLYHSNNNELINNELETNWVGIYLHDTNNNSIIENDITNNGAGITYHDSIGTILSENSFKDNWLADTSSIDSGEMVMATTIYSCGPAALATILKSLGIFTTEAEIARLASTDETGTSLYGLKIAAQSKGLTAFGGWLTTDQLEKNFIVVLSINGRNHIEVVQNITENTITLFDPNLGIIEMSRDKFNELYTGIALVINDSLPSGTVQLTNEEMRNIKAMWHYETIAHSYYVPGYWYWTYEWLDTSFYVPYLYWEYVPGYYLLGVIPIPGHYEPRLGWYRVSCGFWVPNLHYVPGYYATYYTTEIFLDSNDIPKIQPSYEWRGFSIVQDRLTYGGLKTIGGIFGSGSPYGIVPGLVSIWDGLNEYYSNLDKVGSQGWINPK
ncbi:MAG: right-handed parallel beta-helix repeat-containing protein, partial [Methanobacterium sp.]|nr:right-handed parallel beta-helix repeat-containing protein [Methanobacterium sp.]